MSNNTPNTYRLEQSISLGMPIKTIILNTCTREFSVQIVKVVKTSFPMTFKVTLP